MVHDPFVGRAQELTLCQRLLSGHLSMLYIRAPLGLGKSRLLTECAVMAEARHMPVSRLDASRIQPSPPTLRQALIDLPESSIADPTLLIVDGFESHRALEGYYESELWPQLPEGTYLLLAGTESLSRSWKREGRPVHQHALGPLSDEEVRTYLERRAIAADCRELLGVRSQGRPLWLATMAEFASDGQRESIPGSGSQCSLHQLVMHVLREAPSDEHRIALWAAAMVPVLSERLLAAMLDKPRSNECYKWLATRPYVSVARGGISLHSLFRDPLVNELISAESELYRQLLLRCGRYHIARVDTARDPKQRKHLTQMLMSSVRFEAPIFALHRQLARSPLYCDELSPNDGPALDSMVRLHEGGLVAELCARYRELQPEGVSIFRDVEGHPAAFMQTLNLGRLGRRDEAEDPAVAAAFLALHDRVAAMLGRGRMYRRAIKNAWLVRTWMGAQRYQSMGVGVAELIGRMLSSVLASKDLSLWLVTCSTQAAMEAAPLFREGSLARMSDAFDLDGRSYELLGIDFTSISATRLLREALTRMLAGTAPRTLEYADRVATW